MEKKTRLHTQSMHQPVITSQYLLQRLVSFLCGLNFTQTHYLIVTSYLPYHTGPSLLAQATHHHAATCTVRKQFNYDDRWILRTLMMQERGFPSTSKAKDTASHLRADRDSDHDISRAQLCHLAVTPGYVTHASLTYCQRG